jgi:hypothetical protein
MSRSLVLRRQRRERKERMAEQRSALIETYATDDETRTWLESMSLAELIVAKHTGLLAQPTLPLDGEDSA